MTLERIFISAFVQAADFEAAAAYRDFLEENRKVKLILSHPQNLPLGDKGAMIEVPAGKEISVDQTLGNRLICGGVVAEIIERTEKHEEPPKRTHTAKLKEHKTLNGRP